MCMLHIKLSSVSCQALLCFSNYLPNGTNCGKKLLCLKCVFCWFLPNFEKFLIITSNERDIIINVYRSSSKVPLISQMKHQLDATLCRFNFCRVTLHVSGASAHHQEYLKLVRRPLVHVFCKNI